MSCRIMNTGRPVVSEPGDVIAITSPPIKNDVRRLLRLSRAKTVSALSPTIVGAFPNQMMVVPILEGTTFVYGDPRPLFPLDGFRVNAAHPMYDVAPEDDRFLMLQGLDDSGRIIVVDNFFQEMLGRMRN